MKLKYTGPHDEVELPNGLTVKRGGTVDVDAELAGTSPDPRLAVAMLELHEAISNHDHPGAAKLREEIPTLSYGTGLLAQFDNWQVAANKKDEVSA